MNKMIKEIVNIYDVENYLFVRSQVEEDKHLLRCVNVIRKYDDIVMKHKREVILELDKTRANLLQMAKITRGYAIVNRENQTFGKYLFCRECGQHNMYEPNIGINHRPSCPCLKAEKIIKELEVE